MDGNEGELTVSNIRMMDETSQKALLFKSIRSSDLHAIRNILQANRNLLNAKMSGYEGSDVFDIVKNSKTKKCYSITGNDKDGFFYPLHVASESGHKNLVILLIKAGADVNLCDYRGLTAEEKSNGAALHAFYELRGLKFESKERYQGKTDRQGLRHGQGLLFFKPEGYMEEEKQLYRGNFKNNLYNGHGTLYFPGTETIAYIGRFKDGLRHGRGIEFDNNGHKIYQGVFRDDKREGRGEEYGDNMRVYKGEFSGGLRHGFGVAYFPENSKYYGRYENNLMSGVGIYVHPNGDRFEGMFFNNKPDGPGSFYEKDVYIGHWTGHHALWQAGRKIKEMNIPFTPTVADLPDDSNKHMFAEIMNSQMISQDLHDDEEEEVERPEVSSADPHHTPSHHRNRKRLSFCYFDGHEQAHNVQKSDWWKVQLGKYLKLPIKEARFMGLQVPESLLAEFKDHHKEHGQDGDEENDEDHIGEEEEDMEEVSGFHFMECTTLFVSYIYITSASKVFEDRLANKGLVAEFPDFEAVYHLVIDAVDTYNELWEDAYKAQQLQEGQESSSSKHGIQRTPAHQQLSNTETASSTTASNQQTLLESRRKLFMSEKEKKEEMILKQRAELAIKKGTAELNPAIEKEIANEVLETLESELTKLLVEEVEGSVHLNLPISRKNLTQSNANDDNASVMSNKSSKSKVEESGKKAVKQTKSRSILEESPAPTINFDDLFDIANLDATDFDNFHMNKNENNTKSEEEDVKKSNEFVAELLYIMRTSVALS